MCYPMKDDPIDPSKVYPLLNDPCILGAVKNSLGEKKTEEYVKELRQSKTKFCDCCTRWEAYMCRVSHFLKEIGFKGEVGFCGPACKLNYDQEDKKEI